MVPDRPDFTDGPATVAVHSYQVEAGLTYGEDQIAGVTHRVSTWPELLLRTGLSGRSELRLEWAGYERSESSDEPRVSGLTDMSIGAKYRFYEGAAVPLTLAIEAMLSLPVGDSELTSDGYDPLAKFIWSYEINDQWGLSGNINHAWLSEDSDTYEQTAVSLNLGVDLSGHTAAYFEVYGFDRESKGGDTTGYFDTGLLHHINPNLTLDARIGIGLNQAAEDGYLGVGLAFRL